MPSAYVIDEDQRTALEEKVLAALNVDSVVKQIRSKLEEFCQEAIDATTDYLKGEYALLLEDIAKDRAKRLVCELLKGNHEVAQAFRLEASTTVWGSDAGKPFVYDPDGVRKAIFETHKDAIVHAELIALKEENERLRRDVEWYRDRRSW